MIIQTHIAHSFIRIIGKKSQKLQPFIAICRRVLLFVYTCGTIRSVLNEPWEYDTSFTYFLMKANHAQINSICFGRKHLINSRL